MSIGRRFGILVEWKNEGPLIMETKPLTYCEAHDRMESFMEDKRVIRVAMFRLKFTTGNETLIEKEE